MKLYASLASPFARKIRVLLLEKNIAHDIEMISLYEPNTFQKINPIGKVPSLVLDDGRLLVNSCVIADTIDDLYPNPRFIPTEANQRIDVRRWEAIADGIIDVVISSLYEIRFHETETRSETLFQRNQKKIEAGLNLLEQELQNKTWITGNELSLADITIACHVAFLNLRTPHYFPVENYPNLTKHWKTLEERESFKATIPQLG